MKLGVRKWALEFHDLIAWMSSIDLAALSLGVTAEWTVFGSDIPRYIFTFVSGFRRDN